MSEETPPPSPSLSEIVEETHLNRHRTYGGGDPIHVTPETGRVFNAPKKKPIPEHDAEIIRKLYWKEYPDCGRKRGALLRYIKEMKEKYEPVQRKKRFFARLNKIIHQRGL